jgi:probable F420-dependent oxidoreductase
MGIVDLGAPLVCLLRHARRDETSVTFIWTPHVRASIVFAVVSIGSPSVRPFRFGYQLMNDDPGEVRRQAQAAEAAGFDVLCSFDHLGQHLSALAPLAAAAGWTSRIRLCPLVLNNDFHHPAFMAQELASLDRLSGGRLEVGIGAGHSFTEYAAAGLGFDVPAVRKARLAESVELLRRLLDGEAVTYAGEHYRLEGVSTLRPHQAHVPILVGVNGRQALAHAARHADTVGLTMLGRTLPDGQRHEVRWEPDRLDATVQWIRSSAAERWDRLELNALVQAVVVTHDRQAAAAKLVDSVAGLGVAHALAAPFVALGTEDEIAEHFLRCRYRWGISYYVVRELDIFAPIIERLRRADSLP